MVVSFGIYLLSPAGVWGQLGSDDFIDRPFSITGSLIFFQVSPPLWLCKEHAKKQFHGSKSLHNKSLRLRHCFLRFF
jgi:hypothetical protein